MRSDAIGCRDWAISGLRNLSLQENPVVESGVQTPDSDPIKEYKEWLEYRRLVTIIQVAGLLETLD